MKRNIHRVAVVYMVLSVFAWVVTVGSWRYFMVSYVMPCFSDGLEEIDYHVLFMEDENQPGLLPRDIDKRYLIDSETTLPEAMGIIWAVVSKSQNALCKVYAPVDRTNEIYVSVRSHWDEKVGTDTRWKSSTSLIRIEGVSWEHCYVGTDQVASRQ